MAFLRELRSKLKCNGTAFIINGTDYKNDVLKLFIV